LQQRSGLVDRQPIAQKRRRSRHLAERWIALVRMRKRWPKLSFKLIPPYLLHTSTQVSVDVTIEVRSFAPILSWPGSGGAAAGGRRHHHRRRDGTMESGGAA
jgi:hypothetical protein